MFMHLLCQQGKLPSDSSTTKNILHTSRYLRQKKLFEIFLLCASAVKINLHPLCSTQILYGRSILDLRSLRLNARASSVTSIPSI